MIVKQKHGEAPADKFGKAGFEAERKMAYKLKVAFEHASDVFVFNDIRFVVKGHPAQIDHLVLHPFGFVLIESKSVSSQIEVNKQLEFVRVFNGRRQGMDSPIAQVKTQAEILKRLVNENKEKLRRKVGFGLIQAHFGEQRFEPLVAISGHGEIIRKGCDPPELMKSDAIVERIRARIKRRQSLTGVKAALQFTFSGDAQGKEMLEDRLSPLTMEELETIREFLKAQDKPLKKSVSSVPSPEPIADRKLVPGPPPIASKEVSFKHSCRHCEGNNLKVVYGKYGYYFKCNQCDLNTKIDLTCECGEKAKISKRGQRFHWKCSCGNEDLFFKNLE